MKQKLIIFGTIISFLVCIFGYARVGALSSTISPPVDPNTSWFICQGYNSFRTHQGADSYSLDLTKQLCDLSIASNTSSAGAAVYAPLSGKIYWYGSGAGAACLNTTDGRSIMLVHIDNTVAAGTSVSAGQRIGTIAAAGTRSNNGIAHLHIQMWSSPNCNSSNKIPFSNATNSRICGAPDMTATGPNSYNNGTWSGTSFTARSCTQITQKPAGSIYRFWSDKYSGHFYTANYTEAQRVVDMWPDVWQYEPKATFTVAVPVNGSCPSETQPVYRFWSEKYNRHFYTIDKSEKTLVSQKWPDVWQYEAIAYCAATQPTTKMSKPVYRFWSDTYSGHFYTSDVAERDNIIKTWPTIWTYEGVVYHVAN